MIRCRNCGVDMGLSFGDYCLPCGNERHGAKSDLDEDEDDSENGDEDDVLCAQCDRCGEAFVISEGHTCNL